MVTWELIVVALILWASWYFTKGQKKQMTDKKYTVYYDEELNEYDHCTVDWFYLIGLEDKRPVLFTDDANVNRTVCKVLNEELKKGVL